jgi:hypothetical protein
LSAKRGSLSINSLAEPNNGERLFEEIKRMDGRKNNWNGTVTEAGLDGHGTVTLSGQKR